MEAAAGDPHRERLRRVEREEPHARLAAGRDVGADVQLGEVGQPAEPRHAARARRRSSGTAPRRSTPRPRTCRARARPGAAAGAASAGTRQCRKQSSCQDIRIAHGARGSGHGRCDSPPLTRRETARAATAPASRTRHGARRSGTASAPPGGRPRRGAGAERPAGGRGGGPARAAPRTIASAASLSTSTVPPALDEDHAVGQLRRHVGRRAARARATSEPSAANRYRPAGSCPAMNRTAREQRPQVPS